MSETTEKSTTREGNRKIHYGVDSLSGFYNISLVPLFMAGEDEMIKKLIVLVAICLSFGFTGFAKELPDFLSWQVSVIGRNGQHDFCGRAQMFHYVYRNDGKDNSLMEYYFLNGGDKVRLLADQYGVWIFATHFYAKNGSNNTPECYHPSNQKHDFYVRDNPSDRWRAVSWSEAQRFLNARGIYHVRLGHYRILSK